VGGLPERYTDPVIRYYSRDKIVLKFWFSSLCQQLNISHGGLAQRCKVSTRTLTDWKRGKYGIPGPIFLELQTILPYEVSSFYSQDDKELKRASARLGGIAVMKSGRMFGTLESRRRGGLASLSTHKLRQTGFFLLKECAALEKSEETAELVGAIIGDGHLSSGQIQIYLDIREKVYADHLVALLQKVTGYKPTLYKRNGYNLFIISLSGRAISHAVNDLGVVFGNKSKSQNQVPDWIKQNKAFFYAFVRGIYDTDGCLFRDHHTIGGRTYEHMGIALTSYNRMLLDDISKTLFDLDFHPTNTTKYRLLLRKQNEIHRFVSEVKPVNPKHLVKYKHIQEV
jgi:intein/homing endonuclease